MNSLDERKIIFESKPKIILSIIISWVLTIICAWSGYLFGFLFFGLCAVVITYEILNHRNRVIFYGTKEFYEQISDKFGQRLMDLGFFTYSESGFSILIGEDKKEVEWTDIKSIYGYKIDDYTEDEICLNINCDTDISFTISEETAGWYIFLEKMAIQFPSINKNWNLEIVSPAFDTNLTLLFEKKS